MITANSVNSLVAPIAPDKEMDAFDKIISYVFTTEALAQDLKERWGAHPRIKFHDIWSEVG